MSLWLNTTAKHLREYFKFKMLSRQTKNENSHTIGKFNDCMGENKEFILIEKDVWESVCSRVTALSQKIRAYEQTHQPVPQYYNNKELQQLLSVEDKLIRKYRDTGLLAYTKVGDKYWYSQEDILDFLERNKYKSFK